MGTWPSDDLTVAALDSALDSPADARSELLAAVNKIKAILAAVSSAPENGEVLKISAESRAVVPGVTLGDHDIIPGEIAGHLTVKPNAANSAARLYLMPTGSPSSTTAALKLFGSDYESDPVNYRDVGLYYSAADGKFYLNSKANGTETNAPIAFAFQDGAYVGAELVKFTATDSSVVAAIVLGGVNPNHTNKYSAVGAYFPKDAAFSNGKMMRWYNSDGSNAGSGVRLTAANELEFLVGNVVCGKFLSTGDFKFLKQFLVNRVTGTAGAVTPSVSGVNFLQIPTNASPYTVTNFTGGQEGQEITILFSDGNCTVENNSSISLSGSVNFTAGNGDVLKLVRGSTKWFEASRSVK